MSLLFDILVYVLSPLFILLALMTVIRFERLLCPSRARRNPPPSPWKLPVIGNFYQLASSNHRSFERLAQKHGPLMLMHLGWAPVLVASSVDAAREILKTHESMFLDRSRSNTVGKIMHNFKDVTFSPYGDYSQLVKSIVIRHLLGNKSVLSFQQVREEEMALTMDTIREGCGSVVDFSELIISHTKNVICKVVLGSKLDKNGKVKAMIQRSAKLIVQFRFGDYIPCLSWVDTLRGLNSIINGCVTEFDELFDCVIEENLRRKKIEPSDHGESTNVVTDKDQCFLDILLNQNEYKFERENIKAILMDMLVAGTINPFISIEWTLSELLRNPRTMKKLQEEIKVIAQGKPKVTEDDLRKLDYLDAVFKESLRLHPAIPLIPRELSQDVKIMGYDIEARTQVFVNISAIGRDPTLWEEPEEFRPERFLNSPIDYKGSYFELIPFGTGRRGCPGIQYTKTIGELIIANLVYKFDFVLPDGESSEDLDMSEGAGGLVPRKNHLLLVATPHSN